MNHKQQSIDYHQSVINQQNRTSSVEDELVHWNRTADYYKNKRNTFQYIRNIDNVVTFKLEIRKKIIDHIQKQLEQKVDLIKNHINQIKAYYQAENKKIQILTNFTYESCHEKQQQTSAKQKVDTIIEFADQFFIKQKSLIKQTNNMLQEQVYIKVNKVIEVSRNMAVQLKQDYENFNVRINSLQNKADEQEKLLNNLIKQHKSDIKGSKKIEKDQLYQSMVLIQLLQQQIKQISEYFVKIEESFDKTKVLFESHQQVIKDSLQSYFEIKQNQFQYKPDQRIIQQILYQINIYSQNKFEINELLNHSMLVYLNQQKFKSKEEEYKKEQSIKKTVDQESLRSFFKEWNIEMQDKEFLILNWSFGSIRSNFRKIDYDQQNENSLKDNETMNLDQKITKRKSILGDLYLGYQRCCLVFTLDYWLLVFNAEDKRDIEEVDIWKQSPVKQIRLYEKSYSAWESDEDKYYVVQIRNSKNNLMSQGQEFFFKDIEEWESLIETLKSMKIGEISGEF